VRTNASIRPPLPSPVPARLAIWADAASAPFCIRVAEAAGASVIGVGGPRGFDAAAIALPVGCATCDDLRRVLTSGECDAVWIARHAGELDRASGFSPALVTQPRAPRIVLSDAAPSSLAEFLQSGWTAARGDARLPCELLRFVGWPNAAAGKLGVLASLEDVGQLRSVSVEFCVPSACGTLGHLLLGAADVLAGIAGIPETVDASFAATSRAPGLHALPGESLARLEGDALALARFPNGLAATLAASDRARAWSLRILVRGERDELLVEHRESDAAGLMADSLAAALSGDASDTAATSRRLDRAFAIAQAALLSCRTQQPESPGWLERTLGAAVG